jgi:hypothetical protein
MPYRSIAISIVGLLSLLLLPAATAQEANPAASPVAGAPLDLAAMVLVPADFDIPGLGRWFSRTQEFPGGERRYLSRLDAPVEYGAAVPVPARQIVSSVIEFAGAEDAANSFTVFSTSDREDIPGTRVIGEESAITRVRGRSEEGDLPYSGLSLTFRVGNLVAEVVVADFTGNDPDAGELESLAQTYLDRIEQVRAEGGPGLSTRIVRLDAPDLETFRDDYLRIDGIHVPDFNSSAETFARRSNLRGAAIDVYGVSQSLPAGSPEFGDDVGYQSMLFRFADEAAAAEWLSQAEERVSRYGGFAGFTLVPEAAAMGDESRTYAIAYRSGGHQSHGYLISVRVGSEAMEVLLFAQPEAPLALVETLAAAQVACLQSEAVCERIPAPRP